MERYRGAYVNFQSPVRRATLRTLARQLDLSVTTISRALKDGPEVRPDTILRVKAAAEAAGYKPDWRAVNLRTGRTGVIAVVFYSPFMRDDVGDASVTTIMVGICRRLEGLSLMPMIQLNPSDSDGVEQVRRIVGEKLADGVILSGTTPQDPRVSYMLQHRFPFVTFGRTELATQHPWYDHDNTLAAHQATSWVAAQGRRRIALIDPPAGLSFAQHRLAGYRAALTDASLPFDPALVVNLELGAALSRAATQRLLAADDPPDAIVCATGMVALGAMAAIRDRGLVPQRDVLIVSRDGALLSQYLDPPLPTCFASLSDAGWALCDFLLAAIDGVPPERLQRLEPTELILPERPGQSSPAAALVSSRSTRVTASPGAARKRRG